MKAHEILKAAERNDSIYTLAKSCSYHVRTVQLLVKDYFNGVTYKRICIHYTIAKTIILIRQGYTVQNAYLSVTGSYNTSPYYDMIKKINAQTYGEQIRFLEAITVINRIANAKKPITLKKLNCNRSLIIYIRNTLGYSVLSKPHSGYYFSDDPKDRHNCLKWINSWRSSFGIKKAFTFK